MQPVPYEPRGRTIGPSPPLDLTPTPPLAPPRTLLELMDRAAAWDAQRRALEERERAWRERHPVLFPVRP